MSTIWSFAAVIPGDGDGCATTSSRKRGTTTLDLSLVKKSKRYSPPPSRSTTTIDDLSDSILVEILCRPPYNLEDVFQCKRVSKRWSTLISDNYFASRFLCQHDIRQTKPFVTTLVTSLHKDYRLVPLASSSKLPSILSMNFLPIFRALKHQDNGPIVEATFNDLVLCCATKYYQRDYYICNPRTKEWVALPPTPRAYKSKVPVGFICDPYYGDHGKQQQISESSSSSSILNLNADFRCRVVRIVPDSYFNVEIFYSEMGEWREYQLHDLKRFGSFVAWRPGVACNGKLYWYSYAGFTFQLDPFNDAFTVISTADDIIIDNYGFAQTPRLGFHLAVCQGRLLMYPFKIQGSISIWELKEQSEKLEWCLIFDRVSLLDMVSNDPKIEKEKSVKLDVLGFLSGNEDIVYLKLPEQIVVCNLRENTLENSLVDPPIDIAFDFSGYVGRFGVDRSTSIYPYVLPWWPTPVPRINKPKVCQVKVLKQFEIFLVQQQDSQIQQHHAAESFGINQVQSAFDTTT